MQRGVAGLLVVSAIVAPARPALAQHRSSLRSAASIATRTANRGVTDIGHSPLSLQPRRPSEGKRAAVQFIAGSAAAVSVGLAGYFVLRNVSETRVKGDEGYTRSGNVGYLVGSFVGTTLGAHLVGRSMGGKAPLWATSLGGLVGTAPLIALGIDEPFLPLIGLSLGWIPQAALATGGFVMAEPR
jgi:hypothetical protein